MRSPFWAIFLCFLCIIENAALPPTPALPVSVFHGGNPEPAVEWLGELLIDFNKASGTMVVTVKGPSSAWFALGFGSDPAVSGTAAMAGAYSIVISKSYATDAYRLTAAGIEPSSLLDHELDTIDDVTIGPWRRVTVSRNITDPFFDFAPYLIEGTKLDMITATGMYQPGDKKEYGNHLAGNARFSVEIRGVEMGTECFQKDGDELGCSTAGCWWLRGSCRDCIDAGEDSCLNAAGCFYNPLNHKCEPNCNTERHKVDFGYCVPEHWDVNKEDNFTWFEKQCTQYVSPEVKLELLNFIQVQENKHLLIPEELLHLYDSSIEHHDEHGVAPYNILVIFGTFAIGAFVRYFCLLYPQVPYTVIIFVVGMLFGAMGKWSATKAKFAKYEALADMNPHMIFYVFLPVLIFESAFAMEIPIFKKVIGQCIILAGPGLIVASVATGMVAKTVFVEYEWTLPACLLFGTILSATDPVAVVALLKELGASPVISTMIEGESLFNDGTAIVFFSVLKSSVERGSDGGCLAAWETCADQCLCVPECEIPYNVLEIIIEFCKVSFGGPLVGLAMGFITVAGIDRVFNDPLIEITSTLCSAYITFYVCEGFLHVSGVLGLVVLGCYMSYFKECISPEVEHSLHEFWNVTVYLTNTCIFALAGMIVALKAFDDITMKDIYYLFVIYITINVVRMLVLVMFSPILCLFKYKLSVGESCLIAWGGLRGAVGLALALIIRADENVVVPNVRNKFIFHVAGIVILTLIVNGVSTQRLVAYFKLDEIAERKKKSMRDRFADLQEYRKSEIINLGWDEATGTAYYDCNWAKVFSYTDPATNLPEGYINPYMRRGERVGNTADPQFAQKSWQEGRTVYYGAIMSSIHKQYSAGMLGPAAVRAFHHLTLSASEQETYATDSYDVSQSQLNGTGLMNPHDLRPLFAGDTYLKQRFYTSNMLKALNVSLSFVEAHQYAQHKVRLVCEPAVASRIATICKRNVTQMNEIINESTQSHLHLSCALKTQHAARDILNDMKVSISAMQHEGRLDDQDKMSLVEMVEARMKHLQKEFPTTLPYPKETDAFELFPLYNYCDERAKREVEAMFMNRIVTLAAKGSLCQKEKGQRSKGINGVYLVITGIVSLRLGRKMYRYGAGYGLGLQKFLTGTTRFDEVETETVCTMAYIPHDVLVQHTTKCPSLLDALWKQCGEQAARLLMPVLPQFEKLSDAQIRKIARTGVVAILQDTEVHAFNSERRQKLDSETSYTLVLRGRCYEYEGQMAIRFPEMIPNTYKFATFTNHAVIFEMEATDSASLRAKRKWGRLRSKTRTIVLWSSLRGRFWGRVSLALALNCPFPDDVKGTLPDELLRRDEPIQFASPVKTREKRKKTLPTLGDFTSEFAELHGAPKNMNYGDPATLRKNRVRKERNGEKARHHSPHTREPRRGVGSFSLEPPTEGSFSIATGIDYKQFDKTPSSDSTEMKELTQYSPLSSHSPPSVRSARRQRAPQSDLLSFSPMGTAAGSFGDAGVFQSPLSNVSTRQSRRDPRRDTQQLPVSLAGQERGGGGGGGSGVDRRGGGESRKHATLAALFEEDSAPRASAARSEASTLSARKLTLPDAPDFDKMLSEVQQK